MSSIYKEDFVKKRLRGGDVYRIEADSVFYLMNTTEGQKVHIICSIDKSNGVGWSTFQVLKGHSLIVIGKSLADFSGANIASFF